MKIEYDKRTHNWLMAHYGVQTTVVRCDKCGLFYKPCLGHECKEETKY